MVSLKADLSRKFLCVEEFMDGCKPNANYSHFNLHLMPAFVIAAGLLVPQSWILGATRKD